MTRVDAGLVLMVLIWGANFSVMKLAFEEVPPQPFNALRLILASGVFLAAIQWARRHVAAGGSVSSILHTPALLTRRDYFDLVWLGLVGHFGYQYFFVGGVALSTASNAALIIGTTPAVVAVASALLGRERISGFHWAGAVLAAVGIAFVVGPGVSFGGATWRGDLMVLGAVGCWSVFTLGSASLITRHSPLYITGMTMVYGGVPYIVMAFPQILQVAWLDVSTWTLSALVLSALLALNLSYVIWYAGVQRLGASRTAIYSNGVPVVAMVLAAVWLGEALTVPKLIGAAAVLSGVALTRIGRRQAQQTG